MRTNLEKQFTSNRFANGMTSSGVKRQVMKATVAPEGGWKGKPSFFVGSPNFRFSGSNWQDTSDFEITPE